MVIFFHKVLPISKVFLHLPQVYNVLEWLALHYVALI